jgi:hypothetical protein
MVSESSATHHSRHDQVHDIFSIDANHSGLVKFPNSLDSGYKMVQDRILAMVKHAPGVIGDRFTKKKGKTSM